MPIFILKTKIQKLSFSMVIVAIGFISLLLLRYYMAAASVLAALVIMFNIWYHMLGEELFVYELKQNSNKLPFEILNGDMPEKKGMSVINRLIKKGIIEYKNGIVYLKDKNRINVFEERYKTKK